MGIFDKENLKKVSDVTRVLLDDKEAQKVLKLPVEDVKVVQKVTPSNFWKNPRFYLILGSLITAGATGDYIAAVPLVQDIFGIFF